MKKFLLVGIIALASFVRFFHIDSLPASLTWDEVAWGYNAYTLGIDGRDEFGRLLPLDYLESFGDFKPPVYAYLTVIPVWVFGLNEFAVRFASALFGTMTVLVTYFLAKAIFRTKSEGEKNVILSEEERRVEGSRATKQQGGMRFLGSLSVARNDKEAVALVAAGILAISPWHIMLSRGAFEANVSTFFLATGVWLFLEAVQRKKGLLFLSVLSFVLSFYTFNTARIVAPLLVIVLSLLHWRRLLSMKKFVVVAVTFGIVLLMPVIPFMMTPQAALRFQEVNIFSDIEIINQTNQEVANDNNTWWSSILHNRRIAYGLAFMSHYLDNLRFDFLFINGDGNPKFSTQAVGQMYLWELPFFIIGIFFLFRRREGNWSLIPLWLLLALIPAGMARETPHALRIEAALPTFQLLVAYGLVASISFAKRYRIARFGALVYAVFSLFIVVYFFQDYYRQYGRVFASEWQYGYKEAIQYTQEVSDQYESIFFTSEFGRPYVYTAFYTQYDPKAFRTDVVAIREAFGFVTVEQLKKYNFFQSALPETQKGKTLFIDIPEHVPDNATIKKTFSLPNGDVALEAYTR